MNPLDTSELTHLNQLPVIENCTLHKEELDGLRPISKEQEGRIMQKFRLDWNYNSNAIEGNSLDYGETVAFLMNGVTAKGKPLKDYLDIRGHNEAIDYLLDLVKSKDRQLNESDIRALHKMLLVEEYTNPAQTAEGIVVQKRIKLGQYKTTSNHVITITGETHYYATPKDTPILMGELVEWYREVMASEALHPVVIAAIFHHRFTSIHPFDDGNGRMSRLLMNLILLQYQYPPVVIKNDSKDKYYLALSQADTGDYEAFANYIGENMLKSLDIYVRGAKGESIEEPSDLKKKIALFKKEVDARRDRIELVRSLDVQKKVFESSIKPLLTDLVINISEFKDLFLNYQEFNLQYAGSPMQWIYNATDLIWRVEQDLSTHETFSFLPYACTFSEFKLANNSFSAEIKIIFLFTDLQYYIHYQVSTGKELEGMNSHSISQWLGNNFIAKYYHQEFTEQDKQEVTKKIGESLLDFIKTVFEDPSALVIDLSVDDVKLYWLDFAITDELLPEYELINSHLKEIYVNKNRIIIDISKESYQKLTHEDIIGIERRFFHYMQNKIKKSAKMFITIQSE